MDSRNLEATVHLLTEEDSKILKDLYISIVVKIKEIIEKDSLPEGTWFPSEDLKWIIKQEVK